ncbi:four-carbon acid sugar kinase family protein [Synechococcus sp. RSCCF101]|uniref:four-carbon acid sugar kinase family protein n=1 Tax=Synechococcus sp. RSCCF101 TaxID=2511069 RepID=UPI00124768F1|nr:four-carbon acid sugar kinase family protein [Synechococcus sp. RSCCF101]QEY32448.1 four-carbon acid sugar kinase family protein [Synechococcus sp. RSCCF101]
MDASAGPPRILVIDDDPTGSQTVHSCPLLLRTDPASWRQGLAHPSPLLFVLANSRAMDPARAEATVRRICRGFRSAVEERDGEGAWRRWLIVSRGDSTLRGHVPLETDAIDAELGPFAATLHVPAFLEGGRTTVDGVHRLNGVPVAETPFARDRQFGYRHSALAPWLEEKSGGRIPAASVAHLTLQQLEGPAADLCDWLAALSGNRQVAVDASAPRHLQALGAAARTLARRDPPRRLLFRSAASLLNGLAALPPPPRSPAALAGLRRRDGPGRLRPGLVMVGSHVPLADAQLACLLEEPACRPIELPVPRLARVVEGPLPELLLADLEAGWSADLRAALRDGATPVLHSSRGELVCGSLAERLRIGEALARLMGRLAASVAGELGYLISKGGITSHTLLADGLGLGRVDLEGQLLPGLSLVRPPAGCAAAIEGLPVLTFPGNLGDAGSLRQAWRLMEAAGSLRPAADRR